MPALTADGESARTRMAKRRVFHHQRPKTQFSKQVIAALARRPTVSKGVDVKGQRHIRMDPQQLAAGSRLVGMRNQRLAILPLGNLRGTSQELVERPECGNQVASAFLADARNSFHVVDGVSHQSEDIHDLFGRHTELVLDAAGVVPDAFVARIEHANAVAHQLKEVLVAGDDRDGVAGRGCALGHRANDIVGFIALLGQDRHAERLAGAMYEGNLFGQLRWHWPAIGFVIGGEIVAERPAR